MLINIIRTEQAVFQGDHGQDIITAIEPLPGETIEALCQRALTESVYTGGGFPGDYAQTPRDQWYLTIRVAGDPPSPRPEPDPDLVWLQILVGTDWRDTGDGRSPTPRAMAEAWVAEHPAYRRIKP